MAATLTWPESLDVVTVRFESQLLTKSILEPRNTLFGSAVFHAMNPVTFLESAWDTRSLNWYELLRAQISGTEKSVICTAGLVVLVVTFNVGV